MALTTSINSLQTIFPLRLEWIIVSEAEQRMVQLSYIQKPSCVNNMFCVQSPRIPLRCTCSETQGLWPVKDPTVCSLPSHCQPMTMCTEWKRRRGHCPELAQFFCIFSLFLAQFHSETYVLEIERVKCADVKRHYYAFGKMWMETKVLGPHCLCFSQPDSKRPPSVTILEN